MIMFLQMLYIYDVILIYMQQIAPLKSVVYINRGQRKGRVEISLRFFLSHVLPISKLLYHNQQKKLYS